MGAAALVAACRDEPTGTTRVPSGVDAPSIISAVPPAPQRVRWRVKLNGDYSMHSPGVGADGTIYVHLENGKLFAIAPSGARKWVFQAGLGGLVYGPVEVGADGTIYVAGIVPDPAGSGATGAIFALNPNGTLKWEFNATGQFIIAGPNIGPDGNIYAVADFPGIGLFSLTPAGQLRFSTGNFTDFGALGQEIAFGPGRLYFSFDMAGLGSQPSLFGYDLNGNEVFQAQNAANNSQAAVGPNGNVVIETFPTIGLSLTAYSPAGTLLWSYHQFPSNTMEHPDVGPDNVVYSVRSLSTLFAVNPNGTERWRYMDPGILFQPRVGPRNDLLFMGGRVTYGAPGFFEAVSTAGTPLWRVDLPDEPGFDPYGQLVPMTRPVFSPDGNTAYGVVDVAGDGQNAYCFLYAIDVSPTGPVNTVPSVTLAATSPTTIAPGGSVSFRATFTDPDAGDGPWVHQWRFGNGGAKGTAPAPGAVFATRTYAAAGTYLVAMRVTDARSAADTSNVVTVRVR
jgi:hypothetical protein